MSRTTSGSTRSRSSSPLSSLQQTPSRPTWWRAHLAGRGAAIEGPAVSLIAQTGGLLELEVPSARDGRRTDTVGDDMGKVKGKKRRMCVIKHGGCSMARQTSANRQSPLSKQSHLRAGDPLTGHCLLGTLRHSCLCLRTSTDSLNGVVVRLQLVVDTDDNTLRYKTGMSGIPARGISPRRHCSFQAQRV